MKLTFQKKERHDLLVSWLLVSLAFAIMMIHGKISFTNFFMIDMMFYFLKKLLISLVTVGTGFVLHELAHKWVAHQHKLHTEYRSDKMGLIITMISSLFGIVIAAPGAVHIHGHQNQEIQGKVALAGPAANLLLTIIFLAASALTPESWVKDLFKAGALINSFIGLFNLIPFSPFDGLKVFNWNKITYVLVVVIGVILILASYLPNSALF